MVARHAGRDGHQPEGQDDADRAVKVFAENVQEYGRQARDDDRARGGGSQRGGREGGVGGRDDERAKLDGIAGHASQYEAGGIDSIEKMIKNQVANIKWKAQQWLAARAGQGVPADHELSDSANRRRRARTGPTATRRARISCATRPRSGQSR